MHDWLNDFRSAVRSVGRYPVAGAIAVISLAGGIGATAVTLTLRNAIFYNPPPLYAHPEQLSRIGISTPDRLRGLVPAALYRRWSDDPALRASVAAAGPGRSAEVRAGDRLETIAVRPVTPELFPLLGVAPAQGRTFDASPSIADAGTPVLISHQIWQRLFNGRPDVLGTAIWIDRAPHVVIGVMPDRFWFSTMGGTIWTPYNAAAAPDADRLEVIVRSRGRAEPAVVAGRLERAVAQYAGSLSPDERLMSVRVEGVRGTPLGGQIAPYVVWLLGASVLLTLLIACTNVAILMIAQWTAREREIAIRASLGASRARIVRALLAESMLIAAAGGALGVCAALVLRGLVLRFGEAQMFDLSIDAAVLAQSVLTTVAAGVLTGIAPALYETRRLHANPLRLMTAADRVRQRWRHTLVVFEIAATVALLVVTGAIVSGYRRALTHDPGFDTRGLVVAVVENERGVPMQAVLERLRALPGVAAAAAVSAAPLGSPPAGAKVSADAAGSQALSAQSILAGPELFSTLGMQIREGRSFDEQDGPASLKVAIVNDGLVRRMWPSGSPVGANLFVDGTAHRIVGIVRDSAPTAMRRAQPSIYRPVAQHGAQAARMDFVLRTSGDTAPLVRSLRLAVPEIQSSVVRAFGYQDVMVIASREILSTTFPMVPLIATGILLTATGIYGVLAFAMTRRATELAVRVAVGASGGDLLRLVGVQSLKMIGTGIAFGVAATFALTRVAQGSGGLFESPGLAAFAVPVAIVAVIGTIATWAPARRAMRTNPAVLLRSS